MTWRERSEIAATRNALVRASRVFREACAKAGGITPTIRQARKWQMKKGAAWKASQAAR